MRSDSPAGTAPAPAAILVAAIALALGAAACQSQAAASPTGRPGPTATPAASATAGPTASPSPTGGLMELTASTTTALVPGRYTRSGFEPAITFEIGPAQASTWYGVQILTGFFDIQHDVGSPDVVAVQFARPTAVIGAGRAAVPVTDAAAAIQAIRANTGVRVIETSAVAMAGLAGQGVTIEHFDTPDFHPVIEAAPGPVSIGPGRRLWLGFFDTPSGLLAIMVGGSVAHWTDALTLAQPVLATVTVAGGAAPS